jgi:hypothetical protein
VPPLRQPQHAAIAAGGLAGVPARPPAVFPLPLPELLVPLLALPVGPPRPRITAPLAHDPHTGRPDTSPARPGGLVSPEATAFVIDPTRSGAVAEAILGLDYDGTLIHDGWSPYDRFLDARHQREPGRPEGRFRQRLSDDTMRLSNISRNRG